MRNKYGKLPFRETSYFRIARKRLLCRIPAAVATLAQGIMSVKAMRSASGPLTLKRLAIARKIMDTQLAFHRTLTT